MKTTNPMKHINCRPSNECLCSVLHRNGKWFWQHFTEFTKEIQCKVYMYVAVNFFKCSSYCAIAARDVFGFSKKKYTSSSSFTFIFYQNTWKTYFPCWRSMKVKLELEVSFCFEKPKKYLTARSLKLLHLKKLIAMLLGTTSRSAGRSTPHHEII